MAVFFTSDTHFGHTNIIKNANRPYKTVEEMDEALIRNWNLVVSPNDTVWHLGDFSWPSSTNDASYYAGRLNGIKHIIFGNHDGGSKGARRFMDLFASAADYREISVEGQKITICHYAMRVWNQSHRLAWNLYGHSHGTLKPNQETLGLDVGVDCWNMMPASFEAIREMMAIKEFKPADHHGTKTNPD